MPSGGRDESLAAQAQATHTYITINWLTRAAVYYYTGRTDFAYEYEYILYPDPVRRNFSADDTYY